MRRFRLFTMVLAGCACLAAALILVPPGMFRDSQPDVQDNATRSDESRRDRLGHAGQPQDPTGEVWIRIEPTPAAVGTVEDDLVLTDAFTRFDSWFDQWQLDPEDRTVEFLAHGETLARARRDAMKRLIVEDPERALQLALAERTRDALPGRVRRQIERHVAGHGDLRVVMACDCERHHSSVHRTITLGEEQFEAHVYGRRAAQISHPDLPVSGIVLDDLMAVADEPELGSWAGIHSSPPLHRPPPAIGPVGLLGDPDAPDSFNGDSLPAHGYDSWTQGIRRILFIPVAFPDDETEPITQAAATKLLSDVADWYASSSYGTLHLLGDVTPLLILPQTKDHYNSSGPDALRLDALVAALLAGFDPADYDLDVVRHVKLPSYNWLGRSNIGRRGMNLQDSRVGVLVHELGHNFGLWHANFWSASGDSVIGPGSNTEYGNPFDTMGSGYHPLYQFNAYFKWWLDWLPHNLVEPILESGVYRLFAYDIDQLISGQAYALRVNRSYNRDYWIEFRQQFPGNPWISNGVLLNWNPWFSANISSMGGTHLLDTTPGTPTGNSSRQDAAVVVGRTFSDPSAGVHITPVATGTDGIQNWIEVRINLGSFPDNQPPQLELSADSTSVAVGTPVQFVAVASDPDGDELAFCWDFADLSVGPNAPAVSKSWSTAGEYTVRCTVSDGKGGTVTRQRVVTVGNPGTHRVSGRVTGPDATPIEGVRVHNGQTGSAYRGTWTDSEGFYELVRLDPGEYTIAAVRYGTTLTRADWDNPVEVGPDAGNLDWIASPRPTLNVVATDPIATEAADPEDTGTFTLTRTGPTGSALTVRLNLSGTAIFGNDYTLAPAPTGSPQSVTIPAGETSLEIVLHPVTDTRVEGPETAVFSLLEHTAYVLAYPARDTVTIIDAQPPEPPVVEVLVFDDLATEAGEGSAGFTFRRRGDLSHDLTVYYSVSGTATPGVDFIGLPGQILIPAGEATAIAMFRAIDDDEIEGDETVIVTVLPDDAYALGTRIEATAIIQDNDLDAATPPSILEHPQSLVAIEGQPWSLSVQAVGSAPLDYQWYHDGVPVPDGSGSVLERGSATIHDLGDYYVVVSNPIESITSTVAHLSVNRLPVPASPTMHRTHTSGTRVRIEDLLGTDPDGDALGLGWVDAVSTGGGTITVDSRWLHYLPPIQSPELDAFEYTVVDARGASASGTVTVQVLDDPAPGANYVLEHLPEGSVQLRFSGIPLRTYTIQTASGADPTDWQTVGSATADATGGFVFSHAPAEPVPDVLYRAIQP